MSTPQPGYSTITSINFTGGFPSDMDLAPSILFTILYAFTLPILIWRFVDPKARCTVLIRPAVFVLVRMASLILRAVMSKNAYNISELIAELVLVSIGYLFLISPMIDIWKRHVDASSPPPHPMWIDRLAKLLQLLLLASIATAIAGGALTSQAFQSQSGQQKVVDLRHASYILSLITVVVNLLAIFLTWFHFKLDATRTGYLLLPVLSLLIVAVYRVAQTFQTDPNGGARSLAAFWVLQITFEFIAYVAILAIKIPEWYPKTSNNDTPDRARLDSEAGTFTTQNTTQAAPAGNSRYVTNPNPGYHAPGAAAPAYAPAQVQKEGKVAGGYEHGAGSPQEKGIGQKILERSVIYKIATGGGGERGGRHARRHNRY